MQGDQEVVSKKALEWGGSGQEQGGGKVRDGVRRECSVIGRKLIRRRKQDGLGRWGFTIAGRRERGSMRQDKLKDAGRVGITQGACLPFKLCRAMSCESGRRPLRPVRPDEKRVDVRTQNWTLRYIHLQPPTYRAQRTQQDTGCFFC